MKNQQGLIRIKQVSMNCDVNEVQNALVDWIEHGGDIKDDSFIDCGYPLLHYLIIFGRRDVEFVKYLQTIGTDLSCVDERGSNILHIASGLGNVEMIEYCLNLKIFDVNKTNNDGDTALYFALENSYITAAKCLIQNGANVDNIITNEIQLVIQSDKRCLDMMLYLDSIGLDFRNVYISPQPVNFDNNYTELLHCQTIGVILQDILRLNVDKDTIELGNMLGDMTIQKINFAKSIVANHLTQDISLEFNKDVEVLFSTSIQANILNYDTEIEKLLVKILSGEDSRMFEQND